MGEKESILSECHKILERVQCIVWRIKSTNSSLEYELWWTWWLEANCWSEELCCTTPKLSLVFLLQRLLELEKELDWVSDKLRWNVNKL